MDVSHIKVGGSVGLHSTAEITTVVDPWEQCVDTHIEE